MKKKLFIMFVVLFISTGSVLSSTLKNNRGENKEEISKLKKILEKPAGVEAFTLNNEKTELSYDELINYFIIESITCKNGTIATYNYDDNSISLSNIHMPDYCTMDFKRGIYTLTIDPNGGYRVSDKNSNIITESYEFEHIENISERRREGYTLIGYDIYNTDNVNGDLKRSSIIFDSTTKTGIYTQGAVNTTLKAKWSIKTYNINVVVNNGRADFASKTVNYNQDQTFTLTAANGYVTSGASVSCTNGVNASISGVVLTVNNVKSDTTCTVNITNSSWDRYSLNSTTTYYWDKYDVVSGYSIEYKDESGSLTLASGTSQSQCSKMSVNYYYTLDPANSNINNGYFSDLQLKDEGSYYSCSTSSGSSINWFSTTQNSNILYYSASCFKSCQAVNQLVYAKKLNYTRTATVVNSYLKGSNIQGEVTSTSPDTYPSNGKLGDYWYIYTKSNVLYSKGDYVDTITDIYGTYPDNGYSSTYWYVRK